MKNILMIGTGGTIASEMTPEGLTPELNTRQLLEFIPDIGRLCHVDCLQLYSLDSTNIQPENWLGVVDTLRKNYDAYDGFVISHGTDTMAYTAAALSYLVQGSAKPIVLTGAQKPIWFDGTDSKRNLTDAFLYACRGCGGVQIVFNGKVILGTRARKTFSKSFQAFSSVNYPDLAVLQDERLLQFAVVGKQLQLFLGHSAQDQPQRQVVAAPAADVNRLHGFIPQGIKVRVVQPGDVLVAVYLVQRIRDGQYHGLFPRHMAEVGDALGAGDGVLVLGEHGHDLQLPGLPAFKAPRLELGPLYRPGDVRPGQTQHPAAAHSRRGVQHAEQVPPSEG